MTFIDNGCQGTFEAVISNNIHSTSICWVSATCCSLHALSSGPSCDQQCEYTGVQWVAARAKGLTWTLCPSESTASSNYQVSKTSFRKLNTQTDHNFMTVAQGNNKMNSPPVIIFTLGLKRNQQPNQVENLILLPSTFLYSIKSYQRKLGKFKFPGRIQIK